LAQAYARFVWIAVAWLSVGAPALAQTEPQSTPPPAAEEQAAQNWVGLPFNNLAEYERLIPIGMSRRDAVGALGNPEAIMPGQGSDQVYHYGFQLADGSQLRAVIILRDDAVFIRRLYASSAAGATSRVH
jgi:hypothetical protein